MLQHWASEGEFYTGGFVLRQFIESVTFAHCMFYIALHKKEYHIGQIFRYTYKHLEHIRNDVRPEIYIYMI